MTSMGALAGLPFVPLFESVLPDLLLAFTFFTALCYAILGRHFGKERPAAASANRVRAAVCDGGVSARGVRRRRPARGSPPSQKAARKEGGFQGTPCSGSEPSRSRCTSGLG